MNEEKVTPEAMFNQAGFLQIRLHELFTRINRMDINPLYYNKDFENHNYIIMFRDLTSIFYSISGKLDAEDMDKLSACRLKIKEAIKTKPVFIRRKNGVGLHQENWEKLEENLSEFRILIEQALEKYGMGNPDKEVDNWEDDDD